VRIRDAVEMISGGDGSDGDARIGVIGVGAIGTAGPGTWADLGCGDGTFTRALAHLLVPGSVVHAVDLDNAALRNIPAETQGVRIATHRADFTRAPWPFEERLDGILMANSLHYVRDQESFIRQCDERLKAGGRFIVVEYDLERPNRWVPYPVSRRGLTALFTAAGYSSPVWLGSRPSVYQRGEMYAALIAKAGDRPPLSPRAGAG
jgi:SAM-dependent methyltransferase